MVMKDSKDVVDPRYALQFMCHGTNTVMMCVCRLVLMIHFYARDPFWIICIDLFIRSVRMIYDGFLLFHLCLRQK